MSNNTTSKRTTSSTADAVGNRATTREARSIRRRVQKGLNGPALDFAMAIDFDKVAAWINGK